MKGKRRFLRRFSGAVLAGLLLTGMLTLLSPSGVQAQGRRVVIVRPHRPIYRRFYNPWWGQPFGYDPYFDYYSRYGHYIFNSTEAAISQGYHDGLKTGAGDIKNHRTNDPQRSHYFQEAGFGNFGEVYRTGFVRGYAAGYRS